MHALPGIQSSASACDGVALGRLDANVAGAVAHITTNVSIIIGSVEQCVPAFVHRARQRARVGDKQLVMTLEKYDDNMDTLESLLQHLSAGDDSLAFLEDSIAGVRQLTDTLGLPPSPALCHTACSGVVQCVDTASRIQASVDPELSTVSHAPWLTRGECNPVKINVLDSCREPVPCLSPADVYCMLEGDAEEWHVASTFVEDGIVTIGVYVAINCASTGTGTSTTSVVLVVHIGPIRMTLPIKVPILIVCADVIMSGCTHLRS